MPEEWKSHNEFPEVELPGDWTPNENFHAGRTPGRWNPQDGAPKEVKLAQSVKHIARLRIYIDIHHLHTHMNAYYCFFPINVFDIEALSQATWEGQSFERQSQCEHACQFSHCLLVKCHWIFLTHLQMSMGLGSGSTNNVEVCCHIARKECPTAAGAAARSFVWTAL